MARAAEEHAGADSLVGGAAAGDVVDGAGGKAKVGRAEERDQRGDSSGLPTRPIGMRLVM